MPWVKGQSGNPRGRPRGRRGPPAFIEVLHRALRERDAQTRRTSLDEIVRALVARAREGDLDAIRFIAERLDRVASGPVSDLTDQSAALISPTTSPDPPDSRASGSMRSPRHPDATDAGGGGSGEPGGA